MTRVNVFAGTCSMVGAVLMSAAALLWAAPAAADQTDDAYIALLQKYGIVITDRDQAITTGHMVCSGLDKGQSRANLVLSIIKDTNLSAKSAGYIISASVVSYCPQYRRAGVDSLSQRVPAIRSPGALSPAFVPVA